MEKELLRRANILFPRTQYTDPAAVRYARRQWLRIVNMLRSAPGGSRWILDRPVRDAGASPHLTYASGTIYGG